MTTTDERRRPRKSSAGWVYAPALGLFFAVLALLAFQVRAGRDPALGAAEPAAQTRTEPRRVLVRRVIERVVIDDDAPPSAPAPVATPRPAPAVPAPLTTQSS
jgi:hypothetical protein